VETEFVFNKTLVYWNHWCGCQPQKILRMLYDWKLPTFQRHSCPHVCCHENPRSNKVQWNLLLMAIQKLYTKKLLIQAVLTTVTFIAMSGIQMN